MRKLLCGVTIAITALVGGILPASAQDNFYAGKNLNIIVGLSAGGNSDLLIRNIARYLERHIPGNPTIVVQNLPGSGGLRATNQVYELSEPDGLTLYFGPFDPLAQALKLEEFRGRYEEFGFVGGVADVRISQIRRDVVPGGMQKPADIVKATNPILVGDLNATSAAGILARMALDVMGVPNVFVSGYSGGSDVYAAILRNEVHMQNVSLSTWRTRSVDFVQGGQGMGLWYFVPVAADGSYRTNPNLTDVPAFPDVYKEVHGKMPEGPMWEALNWYTNQIGELTFVTLAPPKTPEDRLKILQDAFAAAMNDPEFVAEGTRANGVPHAYIDAATGQAIFNSLADVNPAVLETMVKVIEEAN
jgi:tripartite-type tricarboxylate transporter receptor subunit TctC